MNMFQYVTLTGLGLALVFEVYLFWRGHSSRRAWLTRSFILLVTAVAIARHTLLQELAGFLGIGRGTDVVLYGSVLAFMALSFYFYSRYVRLDRKLTEIIRHLSIQEARRGEPPKSH